MKSKVFFSSEITAEKVVELFHAAANDLPGGILPGKVAVKLHSGEPGNQNFLKPEFWRPVVNDVHGTVVECNTAYDGGRNTTENTVKPWKNTVGASISPLTLWMRKGRMPSF